MSALQTTNGSGNLINFDEGKVALIKRTVAKGATNDELQLFLYQCQRTGLDPLAKQIYFQKFKDNMAIVTGIDGYRLVADRTGKYAGNDDPVFDGETKDGYPAKATVTVRKVVGNTICAFSASAFWDEYYPGDGTRGTMWRKMPHVMLAKCAEALALRKAFPADLSGVYTREEMDQADGEITIVQPPEIEGQFTEPEQADEWLQPVTVSTKSPLFKKFQALGSELYGPNWNDKRHQLSESVSHGRTTSSSELTVEEVQKLIDGMEKKLTEA